MTGSVLYTVGHSDRPLAGLVELLSAAGIATLVDVRAQPQSRRHPQFSESSLRGACDHNGMVYHWAGRQLGGRRPVRGDSPHTMLEEGLRGFADYMQTDAFQRAATQLRSMAGRGATAIMCAERDPARCHRSLIADYLTLQGTRVVHLIDLGRTHEHQLRSEARRESAALIYDRHGTGSLVPE
ncbi:MAG TPA: DUF488 domain-containing protein [Gammaproteobacteria bacterium]|nr:DUF488 domain-containing protein [Gammaproteobacteria bacterium]